ncbi:hypothetical protein EVAR_18255_1 [Eumeta japonica]|uniref:Uncharacterized protein n=1 Tax=Eumeta variegata TaxID=151549 RepID=A0A4C1UJL1_EUMVA|nr:hypothetical protein EVAR_18255_1 [Eumeta japonica]
MSQVSNLVAPFPASTIQPASTHQVITFPDVHVSADEDMPSSSRTFRVSSPTEALWILKVEVVMMIQNFRMTMMPNILSLPPKKIQQNLSNDEELPPQVAASARFMEAEMDVDHEKLLSGDVNFKWQRDFTAFTAVREEFLSTRWCDNDKQPLPNAKASNRLLPVTNQLLTVRKKNNNEENVDDCDERAEAGRAGSKVGIKA